MKISEFVLGRNVEKQAVYRYINRHEELLSKCSKDGKELDMPIEVVEELEKQYPLAKPVVIINGLDPDKERELREQLDYAKSTVIRLQNELTDQLLLNAENETKALLLEDKQKRTEEEVERLKAELEQEKSKTWWQKLRGK